MAIMRGANKLVPKLPERNSGRKASTELKAALNPARPTFVEPTVINTTADAEHLTDSNSKLRKLGRIHSKLVNTIGDLPILRPDMWIISKVQLSPNEKTFVVFWRAVNGCHDFIDSTLNRHAFVVQKMLKIRVEFRRDTHYERSREMLRHLKSL
jgi:hypothetical protein